MTAVFDQGGDGMDQTSFAEGIVENELSLEENITIKRFVSQSSTPNAFGQKPTPIYALYQATAVLVELGVKSDLFVAGVLSAGDIQLQMRERLRESDESAGGSHPGDRLVYRGAEYSLVQRPVPVSVGAGQGAVVFYNTFLRRVNSNSETAGL